MNAVPSLVHLSTDDIPPARRRAALGLASALAAGTLTQSLFWHTGVGLNFWLWDTLVLAGSIALFRRGAIGSTAWGAIVASALLGFSIVLRRSEWTTMIALPATLLLLASVPILLVDRHALADLARLPRRLFPTTRGVRAALGETARLPALAAGGSAGPVLQPMLRGLLLGLPMAAVFTCLLASDPSFASALGWIRARIGNGVLFAFWSLLTTGSYAFTYAVRRARPTPPAANDEFPYRDAAREVPINAPRVSSVAWSVVLAQVVVVFALFVGANFRHLFGGKALVTAEHGLTYAAYLHTGFGELLAATILSVCLVLAGHRMLRPRRASAESAVPGGKLLASLEGILLVLTATTVVSCWQRLRIYEDAYGASLLRLGVALAEVFVLGVLALTFAKSVFRAWKGHAGAVLAFATGLAVVASGFNADGYVARRNLDRACAGAPLDEPYLASLSGDARVALDHPFLERRPDLSARLTAAYCAPRTGDVRALRGFGTCEAE